MLFRSGRRKDTKPSRELADYAGTYSEPAYGDAKVIATKDGLQLKWGKLTLRLDHYHFDTFTGIVVAPPAMAINYERGYFGVQFKLNQAGLVTGMNFQDQDFVLTKRPAKFDAIVRSGMVYDGTGVKAQAKDI